MKPPIFLDWDGVLIDSIELYFDLYKMACAQYGKRFPITDLAGFRDWYQPNWEINFFELGFSNQEYLDFSAAYPRTLDYGKSKFFPGIPDLVKGFCQSHSLLVISTAPTQNIADHLKAEGLFDSFRAVTGSDDGSTGKVTRLAGLLAQLGTGSGVIVGDTDLDIEAGKANNLVTVGVTYGWLSPRRVEAAQPHFLVHKPEDLAAVVEEAVQTCVVVDRDLI